MALGSPGAQGERAVTVETGSWAHRGRTVRLDHLGLKGTGYARGTRPQGAQGERGPQGSG